MLKGLLKDIANAVIGEKLTVVGKVDPALAQELGRNKKEHEKAHKEIEKKVFAYMEQLKAEHEPVCEKFHADQDAVWNKIYDQLGLSAEEREHNYRINHATGVVNRVEIEPKFNVGGDDSDVEKSIH